MYSLRTLGVIVAVFMAKHITVADENKDKSPQPKSVPLSELYVTFKQEGVALMLPRPRVEGDLSLKDLATKSGTSNIFLVRGADVATALLSAEMAFRGSSADRPLRGNPPTKEKPIWAVAQLGVRGSSPPAFEVKAVKRDGMRVRVSFEEKQSRSLDERPYLVWAPLGELEPGDYTLELYNVVRERVVLMRLVEVER
jgi:hypothetical protein